MYTADGRKIFVFPHLPSDQEVGLLELFSDQEKTPDKPQFCWWQRGVRSLLATTPFGARVLPLKAVKPVGEEGLAWERGLKFVWASAGSVLSIEETLDRRHIKKFQTLLHPSEFAKYLQASGTDIYSRLFNLVPPPPAGFGKAIRHSSQNIVLIPEGVRFRIITRHSLVRGEGWSGELLNVKEYYWRHINASSDIIAYCLQEEDRKNQRIKAETKAEVKVETKTKRLQEEVDYNLAMKERDEKAVELAERRAKRVAWVSGMRAARKTALPEPKNTGLLIEHELVKVWK